ncbi:MAG: hypothetical protein K2W96_02075 [Gemmataceae bacterium]|nr:hypothetical protein [Gemmataceae bacterium]
MDIQRMIYPLPEALPGEQGTGWRIRDGIRGRGTDFAEKVIRVPLDDSATSHVARMQEIGRIKWHDPAVAVPQELDESLLFKAVEDHRVNLLLSRSGVDIAPGPFNEKQVVLLGALRGAAGRLAALLLTDGTVHGPDEDYLRRNRRSVAVDAFAEVKRRIAEEPTRARSVEVAGWLRGLMADIRLAPSGRREALFCLPLPGMAGDSCDGTFEEFFSLGWDEMGEDLRLSEIPAAVRRQLPRDLSGPLAGADKTPGETACTLVPWGELRLESPPRDQCLSGKFLKRWKATEEGVFPRYPHRYFVDGRVFGRRGKVPGGTVVIDASGSMSLSSKQIQAMVECAPGCTVACYSGSGKGGVLRILAAGGKKVSERWCSPPDGCGNIVDFPALRWAYKQAHPRVWVSDAVVTGIGDRPGTGNRAMCAGAVKRGRFFTARNTEEALGVLKRLGRYYRKTA